MKYFDTKKSLPVLCSLLITACSGGGGGNNNVPHPPVEKRTVVAPQANTKSEPTKPAATTSPVVPVKESALFHSPNTAPKQNQIPSPQTTFDSPSPLDNIPIVKPATTSVQSLASHKERTSTLPVWTGTVQKKYSEGSWNHSPEKVPVFLIIPNENHRYTDDKLFQLTAKDIDLTKNNTSQEGNFQFSLADSSVYSGYYLDSQDNIQVNNNFVIAFDKNKEYTKKDITANFYNENGFNYAVLVGKTDYLRQVGDVRLFYQNGRVSGEIVDKRNNEVLFRFKDTLEKDPNMIQIVPDRDNPHGLVSHGPDNMFMKMHFINGKDGEPYKYVVGSGKAERYYGTLFATKKDKE
ncbi:hypothetical protein ACNO7O_09985 [Bisgaard Taxon 45]